MFVKMKEKLCANLPKGAPRQVWSADEEQFKIKLFQTICNLKWTFTQKQIPKQKLKFNLLLENEFSVQLVQNLGPPFWEFASGT